MRLRSTRLALLRPGQTDTMDSYDRLPPGLGMPNTSNGVRHRVSFVDDKVYAREFRTGDHVRKTGLRDFVLTPYTGRVLYSNTDTGVIQVQWPWGVENNSPTELVVDKSGDYAMPEFTDQSYSTWEQSRFTSSPNSQKEDAKWRKSLASSLVDEFDKNTKPVYNIVCKLWYKGVPEAVALKRISSIHSSKFGFDVCNKTVADVYESGRRIALYWTQGQRKYKATKKERESGRFACPRCASNLKPRVYRHNRRLMQCRACGFSIHNKDMVTK